jgi:hypothetical protein
MSDTSVCTVYSIQTNRLTTDGLHPSIVLTLEPHSRKPQTISSSPTTSPCKHIIPIPSPTNHSITFKQSQTGNLKTMTRSQSINQPSISTPSRLLLSFRVSARKESRSLSNGFKVYRCLHTHMRRCLPARSALPSPAAIPALVLIQIVRYH